MTMSILDRLRPTAGMRVLVTGGAAGIGATIADAFVAAGSRVAVCDIDAAAVEAMRARQPSVQALVADVSSATDAEEVVGQSAAVLGGLDVLINNAGIAGPTGRIEDLDTGEWERTIATNLSSQFHFLKSAVPHLKASSAPSIVAMSSVAGRLGYPFRTPYASTKWAIVGLVKSLAAELGPDRVRVNAVLPGLVAGPRIDRVIAARAEALGMSFDEMRQSYLEKISLRRMVTEEDIAAITLFLCSPAAANITGQAISVDGNVEYL